MLTQARISTYIEIDTNTYIYWCSALSRQIIALQNMNNCANVNTAITNNILFDQEAHFNNHILVHKLLTL